MYPSRFHTDNGSEFTTKGLKKFCEDNGVKQTFSLAYTPEQNGKIERYWRTLMGTARCFFKQSGAPFILWGHAVLAAVRTLNLTKCNPHGVTPYKLLMGTRLPLHQVRSLRPWGCTAYAVRPPEQERLTQIRVPRKWYSMCVSWLLRESKLGVRSYQK